MKKLICAALVVALLAAGTAKAAPEFLDYTDDEELDAAVLETDVPVYAAAELDIKAPSAILIEKETGAVIYEKNPDEVREPASVTKVMTILLITEELERGTLSLEDMVTTSAYAASMGGSQVFLEEGETMTLRDMLKSIVVSSANDAAVAVAEYISGSETAFVSRMNGRAKELGMTNTVFKNCTGLLDDAEHVTTARDIAIMSRELISHDMIKEFTTIWMDSIRNGEFGLSNTNKLIYYYDGATGLKTGFTQRSKYCLSATAMRDGVEYIAVVMGADTSVDRFESAKAMLSYGFAVYTLISATPDEALTPVRVKLGKAEYVQPVMEGAERLLIEKSLAQTVTKSVTMTDTLTAPVAAGARIGTLTLESGGELLGEYPIIAPDPIERLVWGDLFLSFLGYVFAVSGE